MNTLDVRRPQASLWLLRLAITVHLVAVLLQPVMAGMYLTGDIAAIRLHSGIGSGLAAFGMLLIAVTFLYVVGGRGRAWVLPVAVVQFFAVGLQVGMGYARVLQLHVPLGVAIVTTSVLLAIWVWSPSAGRTR